MNYLTAFISRFFTTALIGMLSFLLMLIPETSHAQFQKIYGTGTSNSFSRVIPHGSNFYALGTDNGQATITRIDQLGNWVWTRRLNIASTWTDGVVIPASGNLMVVGYSLPFNNTNKSLLGEINSTGTIFCVKSLDGPGNEALNRISPNSGGTYTAVGFHTASFRDVVVYNLSPGCTVNFKKQFFSFNNDFFDNDIEVLSGSGDFLVAGSTGNNGLIYRMSSAGLFVSGAQGPGLFTYTDLARRGSGDILAAANAIGTNPPRLVRFDANLFPVWEVTVNGISTLEQVVDGGNGNIYAIGTATINSLTRGVVVKINDSGGLPVLDWARYLDNGETAYMGAAIAALPSGNLAFVDGRDGHPNSFGQTDAFMALRNGDLMSDCTLDAFAFLTFENTLFDGPLEPELFEAEFPVEAVVNRQNLDYMMAEACASDPCDVVLVMHPIDSCGAVQICANATGPQPYSYQWCSSESTQCITAQLSCSPQTFCVSVTCADGSMATASQTFSATDNIPPVAVCAPGFGVELNANCEFAVTAAMVDGGSSDNCQIDSMSVSPNLLIGCGIFQVTLTVTDWCGNTSSCIGSIQAADFDPPTIMCPPNLTLNCDDDTTPNTTGFATATDTCDPNPTITYSDVVVGMLPCDGLIQRTWTATDSCENTATCVQLINVMDNVPPTALCNSGITVYLGTPCTATVTPVMLDGGSTDNCQVQSLAVSPNTFTQCGTPLATLTVTDLCGNMATCQQTITVLDTIPPMISCPPDVTATAFFPDCEAIVNNIHAGATDNCTIQSINYAISGATVGNGGGAASGQTFQSGTSTVTYTAMDGCGNIDTCSFNVTIECDTCSCLGFSNLSFNNFLDQPDISVGCDSTSVELPCIGPDALYSFQWALLCSDPLCMQSVDYQIVPANGGPALISGTAVFPFLSFSYGQLSGPGNYQLILTGNCGGDTCVCVVNFTLVDCCDCGDFSGMNYEPVQDSLSIPVACGDTLAVSCNQIANLEINGLFQCQGSQCAPYPTLNWELKDPSDTPFQSGTVQALPGFSLGLMPAWFTNPGLYTLTITGQCDGEVCPPCVFYFESEGCLPPPENCCFEWVAETAGGFSVGQDIVSDAAGNVYTTGYYSGTVDFDPGPGVFNLTSNTGNNTFVLKLDPAGNFLWALGFGPGQGLGRSIALDSSGDILVVGEFSYTCDFDPGPATNNLTANSLDGFLLKLDAAGNFIWAKQIRGMTNLTGNYNQIFSIAIDVFGNIYFTGRYQGLTDFDPGPGVFSLNAGNQCFIVKLDNSGNFIWVKQLQRNFNGFSSGWSIATDATGNVYTTGTFFFSVDFDPSASVFNMTSVGFQEIFILKLDPAGNFVWAKQIEGVPGGQNFSAAIKVDPAGDVIAYGTFEFTTDFDPGPNTFTMSALPRDAFVLKLDSNGNFVWARQIGTTSTGSILTEKGLDFDASGNIYASGQFYGLCDFDPGPGVYYYSAGSNSGNAFILKLDQAGDFVWAKFMEGTGTAKVNNINISPFADVYTTGYYVGTIDFNPGTAVLQLNAPNVTTQFAHKIGACPSNRCSKPTYTVIRYEPCRYRFQVETINDCTPSLRLQLDTNLFVNWTVDAENGWLAEAISSTEILLTHSSGAIPVGLSLPIEFEIAEGEHPNLTILWDNACEPTESCSAVFLLESCPSECLCGIFSDMFLRGPQGALSQPLTCGGQPLNIGCPAPGGGFTLTGSFQCEGENCPMEADIDWELIGPSGSSVANGTIKSAPWFLQQFPSGYFLQPGVYTLILTGHCGSQTCPCIIKFMVEEGCPDPCPCDLQDLQADVNQGFASTLWNTSCKGCFSPLALSDCDEVEWHIDNPIGPPIGTSMGNQSFCYTFPGAGTYTVYMTVIRKKADGSLCESFVKAQTVTVTCLIRPDCDASILSNPRFNESAFAGPLNDTGASEGWNALVGNPTVVEGESGSHDGWTIQLAGNYDNADVLSRLEPICLEKDTGTISIHLRLFPWGDPHIDHKDKTKWDFKAKFYQGDNFEIDSCGISNCLQLASIDLTPFDTGWATLEFPYDLRDWDVSGLCGGVLVRPAVYVTNLFGEEQGADTTRARLQIDNFCIDGILVGVDDDTKIEWGVRLIPNPTPGPVTLRFEGVLLKNTKLQIFDLWGRSVLAESLAAGVEEHTLSLAELPAGVYLIRIWEEGVPIWVEKLVKL